MSLGPWRDIHCEEDISQLMRVFGGFNDACLKELHLWTEHFVSPEDLGMRCGNNRDLRARILIQRQMRDPSAVELLFEEILTLHIQAPPEHYDSIIYGATLLMQGGTIYFCLEDGWEPSAENRNDFTWIAARKLSWRERSDWMGGEMRFGDGDPVYPMD